MRTCLILTVFASLLSTSALARTLYLNGIDISSARNQNLKNVNLRIDENGNVYIEAPHYQVNEESTYTPLSSWLQGVNKPKHMPAGNLPDQVSKVGKAQKLPATKRAMPDQVDAPAGNTPPAGTEQTKPKDNGKLQDKAGQKIE